MTDTPRPAEAAAAPAPEVLVITAHPQMEHSRVNRQLLEAARGLAAGAAPGRVAGRVTVRDLYALYPDYLIDVAAEQALLAAATLLVWQHPIHWYSMPPLMKLWIDDVLAFGWAYGPGGTALRGKDVWLVASTGGPHDSYRPTNYNRYFFEDFLPPYEQTATLCGMRFLPPLVLHGAHRTPPDEIDEHVAVFTERLGSYPRWPELDALLYGLPALVPPDARPLDTDHETEPAAVPATEPDPAHGTRAAPPAAGAR